MSNTQEVKETHAEDLKKKDQFYFHGLLVEVLKMGKKERFVDITFTYKDGSCLGKQGQANFYHHEFVRKVCL